MGEFVSDQFSRTAMLIGQENIDKLKSRRVAVFGIGGVGGHCAEALCRSGIGAISLFDGDRVDITNINRQIIATHKTIGRDKVEVMRERLLEINPAADIRAHKLFYLSDTADEVDLSTFDYIVDAVDTMAAKLELVCRATAMRVPVICSMGAANKLDPTAFKVADIYETSGCPIARIMRNELRKRGVASLKVVFSTETPSKPLVSGSFSVDAVPASSEEAMKTASPPFGSQPSIISDSPSRYRRNIPASNAFVPPVVGLILAAEVVKDLIS